MPESFKEVFYQFVEYPDVPTERPYHVFQEISFSSPIDLRYISFINYYTAFLTIWWRPFGAEEDNNRGPWRVALNKHQLMSSPHVENQAQSYYQISTESWEADFDTTSVGGLRLYSFQPSASWKTFYVDDIKCWTIDPLQNIDKSKGKDNLSIKTVQPVKDPKAALLLEVFSSSQSIQNISFTSNSDDFSFMKELEQLNNLVGNRHAITGMKITKMKK
ncbi:hypothetical protein RCL1_000698 [Eukaryota sp. TZLM3-RCL]